jgi:hypothetical protein
MEIYARRLLERRRGRERLKNECERRKDVEEFRPYL